MNIGRRIRERRIELGLSVDDLAKKLNKNRATIYRYESNYIENLPTSVLESISKILNVTPAYLMGWENSKPFKKQDTTSPSAKDQIGAFYLQLKGLGWTCDWSEEDQTYYLSNGTTSIKVSDIEFSKLIKASEEFVQKQLHQLIFNSLSTGSTNHDVMSKPIALHEAAHPYQTHTLAAHEQADATEEGKQSDYELIRKIKENHGGGGAKHE